jgi:AraC-like DNA-binding protein
MARPIRTRAVAILGGVLRDAPIAGYDLRAAPERVTPMTTRLFLRAPVGNQDRFLPLHGVDARPLTTIGIGRAGYSVSPAGFEVGSPTRLTHKLIVTLGGEGFVESGDTRLRLTAGTLATCAAGRECRYGARAGGWRRLWFNFADTPRWSEIARRGVACTPTDLGPSFERAAEGFLAEAGSELPQPITDGPALSQESARLLALLPDRNGWALPPPRSPLHHQSAAAELYARMLRGYVHRALGIADESTGEREGNRLDRLWSRARTTLHEGWSIERLALEIHVSPATFHRMTRRRYAMTPGALLSQIKLEQARRFLLLTDEPLKRIASRVGYSNPFAFSNAFKARVGISPQRFREETRTPERKAPSAKPRPASDPRKMRKGKS